MSFRQVWHDFIEASAPDGSRRSDDRGRVGLCIRENLAHRVRIVEEAADRSRCLALSYLGAKLAFGYIDIRTHDTVEKLRALARLVPDDISILRRYINARESPPFRFAIRRS